MGDNAAQRAEWNGAVGRRWASLQPDLDEMVRPFGAAALRAARIASGERVLDVGCGCGDTSFEIAQRVGASGSVLGLDISQPMLEVARQRAADRSLPQIEFREADASSAVLPEDRDLIFSRFGVMFFDAPAQAFAHLRRSLTARGRLAFVCWKSLDDNPWAKIPFEAALEALQATAPPAKPDAPGPFAFADADRVREILRTAGFSDVRAEPFTAAVYWGDTPQAAAAAAIRVGPVARFIRDQADAAQPIALQALAEALAPYARAGRGIAMDGSVWIVTASRRGG